VTDDPKVRRPGNKHQPKTVHDADHIARSERRAKVIRMVNAGVPYSKIAESLGISPQTVARDVNMGLQEMLAEPVTDLIARQSTIIRDLRRANYGLAMQGDKDAAATILKSLDHEAKLFGLYAPARVAVGVDSTNFAADVAKLMEAVGIDPPEDLAAEASLGELAELEGPIVIDADVDPDVAQANNEDWRDEPWVV
jgi:hypothetical protein